MFLKNTCCYVLVFSSGIRNVVPTKVPEGALELCEIEDLVDLIQGEESS